MEGLDEGGEFLLGLLALVGGAGVLVAAGLVWAAVAVVAEDPWDSSTAKGATFAGVAFVVMFVAAWAVAALTRAALRIKRPGRTAPLESGIGHGSGRGLILGLSCLAAAALLWLLLPVAHGVYILFYEYPLVTAAPLLVVPLLAAVGGIVGVHRGLRVREAISVALRWHAPAVFVAWVPLMIALPALQGHALDDATTYLDVAGLPLRRSRVSCRRRRHRPMARR